MKRRVGSFVGSFLLSGIAALALADAITLPNQPGSLHFAVIGDTGTGSRRQYEVASQMAGVRSHFRYDFVLMLGDNIYGSSSASDYVKKFEQPYAKLLAAGVKFYASLGNHDPSDQVHYKNFNMGGKRFYSFTAAEDVRFFALDTNYMDAEQLKWLESELRGSGNKWKICFFHHPMYSSGGRHGSDTQLQSVLEPLFVKHGVSVVLSGHDHFYERIKPQKEISYFVIGGGGQISRGDIRRTNLTAKGYDIDNHFVLMEIAGDNLFFQVISRTGQAVDSGTIQRRIGPVAAAATELPRSLLVAGLQGTGFAMPVE